MYPSSMSRADFTQLAHGDFTILSPFQRSSTGAYELPCFVFMASCIQIKSSNLVHTYIVSRLTSIEFRVVVHTHFEIPT